MSYSKWAMIELLGHRSHYGLVSEVTIAGVQMLRVEIPHATKKTASIERSHLSSDASEDYVEVFEHVHCYSPSALHGLHELTEEQVREALKPAEWVPRALLGPMCPTCRQPATNCDCDSSEPDRCGVCGEMRQSCDCNSSEPFED